MVEITFLDLLSALGKLNIAVTDKSRFSIPQKPDPFVPPIFESDLAEGTLQKEVIFIQASAAVGKSTISAAMSAMSNIPLLDLSKIAVATGTLKALISGLPTEHPIAEFHKGNIPIIIDALDEGRLLSGENSFESFLTTTGEFLSEDRSTLNKPKLIFLGRYESVDLAKTSFEIDASEVTVSVLEVGFFGESAAWELVNAYANSIAELDAAYREHPEPVRTVISAYFLAIAFALGLSKETLWASEQGRAFAGYAPVLAALGTLLAQTDNFAELANRLSQSGNLEAWTVIESVIRAILDREQKKLCDKLRSQIAKTLPSEIYDASEQMALLLQHVDNAPLSGSKNKMLLDTADRMKYQSMVSSQLPEHPFVRQQEFRNIVLGSFTIASGILNGTLSDRGVHRAGTVSKDPFLWRSLSANVSQNNLIDGQYVGYLLNSFWNDPVNKGKTVRIISSVQEVGCASIIVLNADFKPIQEILVTTPISLYSQICDCEIDFEGSVKFVGHAAKGASSQFQVRGRVTLICQEFVIDSGTIRFDGESWFEAGSINASPRISVYPTKDSKIGWGGIFRLTYPWNLCQSTLEAPYYYQYSDPVTAILQELSQRTLTEVLFVLDPGYTPQEGDSKMNWIRRKYLAQFPNLIRLMVKHEIASSESFYPSGSEKIRIRININLKDLLIEIGRPGGPTKWQDFISESKSLI